MFNKKTERAHFNSRLNLNDLFEDVGWGVVKAEAKHEDEHFGKMAKIQWLGAELFRSGINFCEDFVVSRT